jgi:hypothetical protein
METYFISVNFEDFDEAKLLIVLKEFLVRCKDNDLNVEWVLQELNKTKLNGRDKQTTYYNK